MAGAISLLPPNATPLERALEIDRFGGLADPVRDTQNIERIDEARLAWLAWGLSTDLWNPDWSGFKKRSVVCQSYDLHRLKGTLHGTRRHIELLDGTLLDHRVAPEGYFAAPDVPKEDLDAYIRRHPTVRVFLGGERGSWNDADGFIADHSFEDDAAPWVFDAPFLIGRRAMLVQGGVETPLRVVRIVAGAAQEVRAVAFEQVRIPGRGAAFAHADEFAADASFADAFDDPPRVFSYALDRSYRHSESRLELTRVSPGFMPRDLRYERQSIPGTDPAPSVCAGDFVGEGFVGVDDGRWRLADVIRLVDPSIPSPVVNSGSFAGRSRVGFAPHMAELQINWNQRAPEGVALISDQSFAGLDPVAPNDTQRRDELLDAVVVSKRLSDRMRVTFRTRRERTLGDGISLSRPQRLDQTSLPFTL